jgi:SAM-dependent methyltransferase
MKALRQQIPQLRGRMMDFGCGLKPYQSLFLTDEYIGVDYQGEGKPSATIRWMYLMDIHAPFPDNYFDSIFSSEVFEHVFNLPEIITELHRVLKPGGKILVSCPFAFGEHETPADFALFLLCCRHLFETSGLRCCTMKKQGVL